MSSDINDYKVIGETEKGKYDKWIWVCNQRSMVWLPL